METKRPNPDKLLKKIENETCAGRGKLKIFFGYAAGVGKTYAMLKAAHRAKDAGIDVVAGYIEPHTRPETMKLLQGIEQLPVQRIRYKNLELSEFNLDEALERKPSLILVDELAHTNAEGTRHLKRYQDIEELLQAGINVYTTVNVQHLESLNDVVSSITGIVVSERIPDKIFDMANQVEVVDVEPEDLINRLEAGKIYRQNQAEQALGNFFTRQNLIALREIAFRRSADRLNHREADTDRKTTGAGEHILICLSAAPSNAKVIRTAARMAEAFHASFTALLVEDGKIKDLNEENKRRLRINVKLAEDMDAKIATVYGDDAAVQIAEYAQTSGVTKIVIGHTNHKKIKLFREKSLVDKLAKLAPDIDIYIIPDRQPSYKVSWNYKDKLAFTGKDIIKSLFVIIIVSVVGMMFDSAGFSEANIITVYILGVLFTSLWTNSPWYGACVSFLSVIIFNFLFTAPRFTLQAYDAGYPITFFIMLIASFITSSLTIRVKRQASQAVQKAYRTEILLETSQKLQKAEGMQEILEVIALQLYKLLDRAVIYYAIGQNGGLEAPRICPAGDWDRYAHCMSENEQAVARWVQKNGKQAGVTTNTLPSAKCLYLAVRGQSAALAVVGIVMEEMPELDAFERNLLIAMLDESGMVLEKEVLRREKQEITMTARQEALRANLLRTISHDLRTPLTSITGNAGILMENSVILDEYKKKELYVSIYDDSMWLVNLVENLLSVTRIEKGTMRIKMESELLEDVFHEAIQHLDRRAGEHMIHQELTEDLLMAHMDARLIVQVLINIMNNAIKYTPEGSRITLRACRKKEWVEVSIADDGPGVPDAVKDNLFEMFYSLDKGKGDSRRGMGLGLSLCKSIIMAHGGTIGVRDNHPKGAVFYFTLYSAEVNPYG